MPKHGAEELASIHGAMVGSLDASSEAARAQWIATLESPTRERMVLAARDLAPRSRQGRLVGGNLAMLHACAAAGRLTSRRGSVLLIEDIGERPYRVDRMLTNSMAGGHLGRASAVLVGELHDCDAGPDGTTVARF